MTHTRALQIGWIGLALAALVSAGLLQEVIDDKSRQYDLQPPERMVSQSHPELALLSMAPGPLRAPAVNYLWIRAQELKEAGRYYEANQLSELICLLQPRSAGVWGFHAWNMAWNISAAVKTPQERWLWVNNGLNLLRDRGIPLNPRSFLLYRELAWIFFNKIGGTLDEQHRYYKQQFAREMNQVLGAPPAGRTEEVIEAFSQIASAPLDRDPRRQKPGAFQTDVLQSQILNVDDQAKALVKKLKEQGISIDRSLLDAYRRWSNDPNITLTINLMQRPDPIGALKKRRDDVRNDPDLSPGEQDERAAEIGSQIDRLEEIRKLMTDKSEAPAREKLIAWVRAQILWNTYRMDPQKMLELMTEHNVPLDWRLPWSHGMYWSALGFERGQNIDPSEIHPLNTQRILLNSLKDLNAAGRLIYMENFKEPENPGVMTQPDVRYVWPTHRAHVEFIERYLEAYNAEAERTGGKLATWKDNVTKAGHLNFLKDQIFRLILRGERQRVAELWRFVKEKYDPEGAEWQHSDPRTAMVEIFWDFGKPTVQQARIYTGTAIETALRFAAEGSAEGYRMMMRDFALKIYARFHDDIPERNRMQRFHRLLTDVLKQLLVAPQLVGANLTVEQKSTLWKFMSRQDLVLEGGRQFKATTVVYDEIMYDENKDDEIVPPLRRQAAAVDRDADALFPEPPNLEAYRTWQRNRIREAPVGPRR